VVLIGVTQDTAEFAVESIRRWWKLEGRKTYPAPAIADLRRCWGQQPESTPLVETQPAALGGSDPATDHRLSPPPGTSKWNTIEHRLLSFISLNWKGQPLINYETIINLIGGTKNSNRAQSQSPAGHE
jgi:hypothetical protein